jgi:hypothetical protein
MEASARKECAQLRENEFVLALDKKKKIFETPSHCVSGPAIKATVKPSFFHLGAETWNQPSSTHPLYFS